MKAILVSYLIGVHLFLALVLIKSDFVDRVKQRFEGRQLKSQPSRHYEVMLHFHRCMDGNVPPESVLFFGDSLIQGLLCSRVHDKAVNFGIGTDTTSGVLDRLEGYSSIKNAALIVFGAGLNDLFFSDQSDAEIMENLKACSMAIDPGTPIVFNAILPVHQSVIEERNSEYKEDLNERILKVNRILKSLCDHHDHFWFCDPTENLITPSGNLKISLHNGDGIHLNSKGNEIWIAALKDVFRVALPDVAEMPVGAYQSAVKKGL